MNVPRRTFLFVVLAVVLVLLPIGAWGSIGRTTVTIGDPNRDLLGVLWTGSLQLDGTLAVRIRFTYSDRFARGGGAGQFQPQVPSGATHVTIDGQPAEMATSDIGPETVLHGTTYTISYELHAVARRASDGVLLETPLYGEAGAPGVGFESTGIQGVLYLDPSIAGSAATWVAPPLRSVRAATGPGVIRFSGVGYGDGDARLLALLPLNAAYRAADLDAPSARSAYESRRAEITKGAIPNGAPSDVDHARRLVLAAILTAEYLALVGWALARLRLVAAQHVAADHDQAAVTEPPSGLSPDLVGLLVGDRGRGNRSVVAATLLDLGRRNVIEIKDIDADRFTLTIPPGAVGTTPAETLLLDALRPQGQRGVTAELTGPPLWGDGPYPWARAFRADVVKRAKATPLFGPTLPMTVLVVLSALIPLTAWIGSPDPGWLAPVLAFVAPLLAVATSVGSGLARTRAGNRARSEWLAFADSIRGSGDLADVGVPGLVTWGPYLAYGAALGNAPKAAEALSPRQDI